MSALNRHNAAGRATTDDVKRALRDPNYVARRLGIERGAQRQANGGLMVRCPGHDDRRPSCSIRLGPDGTIAVHCHAACGLSGDVFHLVAAVRRLDIDSDFPAVLAAAAEIAGPSSGTGARPLPDVSRRVAARDPLRVDDASFAAVVAPLIHAGRLDDSPIACDVSRYVDGRGRGLLIAAREEGWAALPPSHIQPAWLTMLYSTTATSTPNTDDDHRYLREERHGIRAESGIDAPGCVEAESAPDDGYVPAFTREDIARSGLVARHGFTWPDARLCIPWRDPARRIYTLQRRRVDDNGAPKYVSPKGRPFSWPYGIEAARFAPPTTPIAWVEGAFDVLALRLLLAARGEAAIVLGIPGLGNWHADWARLGRGRVNAVAVDADAAGQKHVATIARDLRAACATPIERWIPPSKDWAQSLREAA